MRAIYDTDGVVVTVKDYASAPDEAMPAAIAYSSI
jgi:hypothetical protein